MEAILKNPAYHDILSIIKGFRNGAVYGAKIRFPHALVMTFLFRDGSFEDKMRFVLKATYQHSRNLSRFVFIYKTLMVLQRRLRGGKENSGDAFIAGLIGGYWVFGKNNNINNQIVLYLFSRIMVGVAKMAVKRNWLANAGPLALTWEQANSEDSMIFPAFAALVWAIVMWLFRHERDTLQSSLQASMHYLYNDSEKWDSLRNLLWHNK